MAHVTPCFDVNASYIPHLLQWPGVSGLCGGRVRILYAPNLPALLESTILFRPRCFLAPQLFARIRHQGREASFPDPAIRRGLSPPRKDQGYISPSTPSAPSHSPHTSLCRRSSLTLLCTALLPCIDHRAHGVGQTPASMAPRRSTRRSLLSAPNTASPPPAAAASKSRKH
jgi:hypothetical protein